MKEIKYKDNEWKIRYEQICPYDKKEKEEDIVKRLNNRWDEFIKII